jgi:hypothetical protein
MTFPVAILRGPDLFRTWRDVPSWHERDMPPRPGYVGFRMYYGRDVLAVSLSHFGPEGVITAEAESTASRPPARTWRPHARGMLSFLSLGSPRTGGTHASHNQTPGIDSRDRRRGGSLAA